MPHSYSTPLTDLFYICAFFLGALGFSISLIVVVYLLAPRSTRSYVLKTKQAIECGMDPIGEAWIRFGVVYYLYALIFIAFSVDVLYLLPVALIYNSSGGWMDFYEILVFIGILCLVLIYAWKKGVFTWNTKLTPSQR